MDQATTPPGTATRRAWLNAGAPIIGLVVLVSLLALFLLIDFARQQDRDYADGTRQLVSSAIEARAKAVGALSIDYANWDAAYRAVTTRFDPAWLSANFYSSTADALLVFRPGERVRYAWYRDESEASAAVMTPEIIGAASRIPNLDALARTIAVGDGVANTMLVVGGRLAVITVAPVTPEDDAARLSLRASDDVDYLVSAQFLDASQLAAMGDELTLSGLSLRPGSVDSIAQPLTAADGAVVGALHWANTHPGGRGLMQRIWIVLAGLLLAGALTVLLARALVQRQLATLVRAESLVESSRLKSEFIATMSHELRTPLNAIIGYAELIREETESAGEVGEIIRQDLERIVAAGRHLSQLVSDILDQSRLDAGKLLLNVEPLSVENVLAEIVELVEPLTEAKNNRITVSVDPRANRVLADHARARQCLLNLVGNAVRFTADGVIAMRTRKSDDARFVIIDVVDTGIGMGRDEIDRLFAPFAQENESTQDEFGGPSLGLAISRKLARAMGGDISVISEPGKGAMFSLKLPVATSAAVLEAA